MCKALSWPLAANPQRNHTKYMRYEPVTGLKFETDSFRMYRNFTEEVNTFRNVYFGMIIMKYSSIYLV
jgi:hypothetical protein